MRLLLAPIAQVNKANKAFILATRNVANPNTYIFKNILFSWRGKQIKVSSAGQYDNRLNLFQRSGG